MSRHNGCCCRWVASFALPHKEWRLLKLSSFSCFQHLVSLYILWLQHYDLIWYHWTSQSFSEHLRQPNLSMLALRVVTAWVLAVLSDSFTFQTETLIAFMLLHMVLIYKDGNMSNVTFDYAITARLFYIRWPETDGMPVDWTRASRRHHSLFRSVSKWRHCQTVHTMAPEIWCHHPTSRLCAKNDTLN